MMFIDRSVSKRCYNMYDSFGEICVGCCCCSKDPKIRAEARYDYHSRRLQECKEQLNEPDFDEYQLKNIRSNIKYHSKRKSYYKKRLEELNETVSDIP